MLPVQNLYTVCSQKKTVLINKYYSSRPDSREFTIFSRVFLIQGKKDDEGETECEKDANKLAEMTIAHDQIPTTDIETRTENETQKTDSKMSIQKRIQRFEIIYSCALDLARIWFDIS